MSLSYPTLTEIGTTRDFIESFGGYNHNLRIGENEFYDMKNLTSTYYPVLSSRQPRGIFRTYERIGFSPVGMIELGDLYTVEVNKVESDLSSDFGMLVRRHSDNKIRFFGSTTYGADVKRQLVAFGAYIVILPDKIFFNTVDFDKTTDEEGNTIDSFGESIEKRFISSSDVTFSLCRMDGTDLTPNSVGSKVPTDATNGYLWLDTSVTPASLKQYSEASDMWVLVAATYIKIQCTGIGKKFNEYDGVRISGIAVDPLSDLNNAMVIYSKADDYIVVVGVLDSGEPITQKSTEQSIKVEREMPDMEFVIESNNRLWGCHHGLNRDGEMVNEIYASKLGDFKNWEYFGGTSQDSYMVSLGSDGDFTGAISYNGIPLFFKQDCIHSIYGNYPATYQLQTIECRGVQKGCHNSLAVVDGVLYYKALGGVCTFTGGYPVEIGTALGEEGCRYYGAYGGVYRHKYYIGMYDALESNPKTELFVYDTQKGFWHKEDEYNGNEFCYCRNSSVDKLLYLVPYYDSNGSVAGYNIKNIIGEGDEKDHETINWFAETGIMGCSSPDKKYISRISLRLSLDVGTRIFVSFEYDSSGVWEQVATITGTNLHTFTLPIKARRCDHLRMKIEGNGAARIYSISKTIEQGSDV